MKCLVSGRLLDATQENKLEWFALNGVTLINSCVTASNGDYGPVELDPGRYLVKVNEAGWALTPSPFRVWKPIQETDIDGGAHTKAIDAERLAVHLTLIDATGVNLLCIYALDGVTKIICVNTDESGEVTVNLPAGSYRVKVNNCGWAQPNPMRVWKNGQEIGLDGGSCTI